MVLDQKKNRHGHGGSLVARGKVSDCKIYNISYSPSDGGIAGKGKVFLSVLLCVCPEGSRNAMNREQHSQCLFARPDFQGQLEGVRPIGHASGFLHSHVHFEFALHLKGFECRSLKKNQKGVRRHFTVHGRE